MRSSPRSSTSHPACFNPFLLGEFRCSAVQTGARSAQSEAAGKVRIGHRTSAWARAQCALPDGAQVTCTRRVLRAYLLYSGTPPVL